MAKNKTATLAVPLHVMGLFANIGQTLDVSGNEIKSGSNFMVWENPDFGCIRIVYADANLCFYFLLMHDGKPVIDITGQVKNVVTLKRRLRDYLKRVVAVNAKRTETLLAEIEKLSRANRELEARSIKQLDFDIEHN